MEPLTIELELLKAKIANFSFDTFTIRNKICIFLKLDGLNYKYNGGLNQDNLKTDFSNHISSIIGFSSNRIIYSKISITDTNILILFQITNNNSEKTNSEIISDLDDRLENDNVNGENEVGNNDDGEGNDDNQVINNIYGGLIGTQINKDFSFPLKIVDTKELPLGGDLIKE